MRLFWKDHLFKTFGKRKYGFSCKFIILATLYVPFVLLISSLNFYMFLFFLIKRFLPLNMKRQLYHLTLLYFYRRIPIVDTSNIQKQPPGVFLRKVVLKICSKFTEEHPCKSVISMHVSPLDGYF